MPNFDRPQPFTVCLRERQSVKIWRAKFGSPALKSPKSLIYSFGPALRFYAP